jgi:hypothetical protein
MLCPRTHKGRVPGSYCVSRPASSRLPGSQKRTRLIEMQVSGTAPANGRWTCHRPGIGNPTRPGSSQCGIPGDRRRRAVHGAESVPQPPEHHQRPSPGGMNLHALGRRRYRRQARQQGTLGARVRWPAKPSNTFCDQSSSWRTRADPPIGAPMSVRRNAVRAASSRVIYAPMPRRRGYLAHMLLLWERASGPFARDGRGGRSASSVVICGGRASRQRRIRRRGRGSRASV